MIKNTKQITVEVNEILLQEMSKITNDENNIIENKDLEEVIKFYKKENTEKPKSAARAIAEAKTHTLY